MDERVEFIAWNLASIAVIFLNGWYRCKYNKGKDPLMSLKMGGDLDGWSITHLLFFMFLGYRFPNYFFEAFLAGAFWELLEEYLGENRPSWMGGFGDCSLSTDQLKKSHKNWWFGRASDLIVNMIGFVIGQYLRTGTIGINL